MRTLIIAAEYPPVRGGVATLSLNLARAAAFGGDQAHVVTCAGDAGAREEEPGITVFRRRSRLGRRVVQMWPLAAGALDVGRTWRPDLVVCARVSHEGLPGLVARRVLGARTILVAHGSELLQYSRRRPWRGALVRVLDGMDAIVVNSGYTGALVRRLGVPSSRIRIVRPPIHPDDYCARPEQSIVQRLGLAGRRFLLTVGQLVARKGHAQVIRALAQLHRYPELAYVIVGAGTQDALRALAADFGIADRVVFAGSVSAAERNELYAGSEIYVMPCSPQTADVEGFGIAFLEAAFFGKPSVGGKGGGVAEAILDDETGVLVDGRDHEELTRALETLLEDASLRARLGARGRERVQREFSIAALARALHQVCAS